MPIATAGFPDSTFHKDALLIPARSATNSADKSRRNLASLICSPIVFNISSVTGTILYAAFFITTPLFSFMSSIINNISFYTNNSKS